MFAVEDGLAVQLEESLLPFFDAVAVSQVDPGHGDESALHSLKMLADLDAQFIEGAEIVGLSQFFHEAHDFFVFFVGTFDGPFGYLFPPKFIEVLRNASHEAEFWDKQNLEFTVLPPPFHFKQGLLEVSNFQLVFLLVVVLEGGAGVFEVDGLDVLEDDILDLVVCCFAVVGHDDLSNEFCLEDVPSLLPVPVFVYFVEVVDDLKNALISDDLLGGIDSEVVAVFEEDEIGSVAAEHHEVIDVDFLLGVEVLSGSADLHVVESAHDVAESVVQEAQEQVGVLLHVQHFHLLYVDALLSRLNFK